DRRQIVRTEDTADRFGRVIDARRRDACEVLEPCRICPCRNLVANSSHAGRPSCLRSKISGSVIHSREKGNADSSCKLPDRRAGGCGGLRQKVAPALQHDRAGCGFVYRLDSPIGRRQAPCPQYASKLERLTWARSRKALLAPAPATAARPGISWA